MCSSLQAITYLQSVARLKGSEEVEEGDVIEIAGVSSYMYMRMMYICVCMCSRHVHVHILVHPCVYRPGGVPDKLCIFPADER